MSTHRSGAPGAPPGGGSGTPSDSDAPVAGVSSRVITAATRRVARRWRDEGPEAGGTHPGTIPRVLPPLALAAAPQRPHLLTDPPPPPPPRPGPPLPATPWHGAGGGPAEAPPR